MLNEARKGRAPGADDTGSGLLATTHADATEALSPVDHAGHEDPHPRRLTLADSVYLTILRRIALGALAPGDKLPSEQVLCEEFEVSRPVLRRALDRLREDGVIFSRRGSGSYVASWRAGGAPGFAPIQTIADLQCSYEFRLAVEPEAASLAALRHDRASIERLELAYAALDHAITTRQKYSDADYDFHLAVCEASNNHYYASTMAALSGHISLGMRIIGRDIAGEPAIVRGQHRAILDAIRSRDPQAARAAMETHVNFSRNRLFDGRSLDLSLRAGDLERWRNTAIDG